MNIGLLIWRWIVAFVAALIFFAVLNLLTLLPQIVKGPFGTEPQHVSAVMRVLWQLTPLDWVCAVGAVLVCWCFFRASAKWSPTPAGISICVFGLIVGIGALGVYPCTAHFIWLLSPPKPTNLQIAFNCLLIAVLVFTIIAHEIALFRTRKSGPGQKAK